MDDCPELPEQPSLEQLRNQAKDLRDSSGLPLWEAQLAVARRYGFASWTRLKRHVELLTRYSRFPERVAAESDADRFLRLACLSYYDDEPGQWDQARRILEREPGIAEGNVYVAAAAADADALRRVLAADPAAASREGGPFRWEPLCYLAYARHDPGISREATLEAARLLLDAEADPNAGYLWHGLPTPFTVLTGVFGEGELGPVRQPRHPHSLALARLLLEAGADPNDGQALYNRMFEPGNDHLELLFEFGLGTGDGGPWRRRLGDALDSPAKMVRGELAWAITHGMTQRVRLLVEHGTDVTSPLANGATATSMAATTGHQDLVGLPGRARGASSSTCRCPRRSSRRRWPPTGPRSAAARRPAGPRRPGARVAPGASGVGRRLRRSGRSRAAGGAGLRRQRQGAYRHTQRPAVADGAAQGGRRRQPRARPHAAAARRRPRYP